MQITRIYLNLLKSLAVIGGLLLSATAARAQEIPVVNDEVLGFTGRFSASVDWKAYKGLHISA